MDKSKFDFSVGKTDIPAITLLTNGISFNQLCIAALGEPNTLVSALTEKTKLLRLRHWIRQAINHLVAIILLLAKKRKNTL